MKASFKKDDNAIEYLITDEELYRDRYDDGEMITIERDLKNKEGREKLRIKAEAFWKLVEAAKVMKNENRRN